MDAVWPFPLPAGIAPTKQLSGVRGHAGRWSQERNQQMLAELTALRSRFHHDDVVAVASAAKSQVRACVGRWERLPFG
jgi:hypothetical protein